MSQTKATAQATTAPAPPATAAPAAKPEKKEKPQKIIGRGQVKSVPSGDTLLVIPLQQQPAQAGQTQLALPPGEITLTLSGITAPKLASGAAAAAAAASDEPFAWESREYLRRRCIGQVVSYVIHTATAGGRAFGSVTLGREDLSREVVSAGWAVARPGPAAAAAAVAAGQGQGQGQQRPEAQALTELEDEARADGRGMHAQKAKLAPSVVIVRPVKPAVTPLQFFEAEHTKEVRGIVEGVRTGSVLRVTFVPSFLTATVSLAGVICPAVRWVQDRRDFDAEPFGLEARQFVESHVLHRDATLSLKGIDKQDNFVAVVTVLGRDLAEELLKLGFARLVGWAGVRDVSKYHEKLAAAQAVAVSTKLRLWEKAVPAPVAAPGAADDTSEKIIGKVVDVPSAGVLVVAEPEPSNKRHRIMLASIRAPKMYREEPKEQVKGKGKGKGKGKAPAASEDGTPATKRAEGPTKKQLLDSTLAMAGREHFRTWLFGNQVVCKKRYERGTQAAVAVDESAPPAVAAAAAAGLGVAQFWDVYFDSTNVAMPLINSGVVEVVAHRPGEPRSFDYDAFCLAEKKAQLKHRGLFAPINTAEVHRINDLTLDQSLARSTKFLPFLQRGDETIPAIVEYVFSSSRIKVFVPSQNAMVALVLSGIRTPRHSEKESAPGAEEGLAFVRDTVFFRDVVIHVESVDARGNFLGIMHTAKDGGQNLAVMLVARGLASVAESSAKRTPMYRELREAEEAAKAAKLCIWANWSPEVKQEEAAEREKEFAEVVVTDMAEAATFWIQNVKDGPVLEKMTAELTAISEKPEQLQQQRLVSAPRAGELVISQFSDGSWYRARVTGTSGEDVVVSYLDFGTVEAVAKSKIQPLPRSYEAIQPLARRATLANITPPEPSKDEFADYLDFFKQLTEGKQLTATIEWREGQLSHVSLADASTHVNCALVKEGLAKVSKSCRHREDKTVKMLLEAEEKAHAARIGVWVYGDDSDDEY